MSRSEESPDPLQGEPAAVAPPNRGLRERHKLRTRLALRDTALDLFLQRGFEATTVEDVAAAVDVSPRTFFRYFPTKGDVVVLPYVDLFDHWESLVRTAPAGQALIDVLREASHFVTEAYEDDSQYWDRHHQAVTTDPSLGPVMLQTQARLQQRAAAALADRLGLDPLHDLRPRIIAAAAMTAVGAAVTHWYAAGKKDDRRAAVDAAYEQVAVAAKLLHQALPIRRGHEPTPLSAALDVRDGKSRQ
jgi:AcrR family transcriptional regulator